MSIWDDFLDLFKTKEQLNKEKDEKYYAILDDEKEVMKKIRALQNEYENSIPKYESVNYDEKLEKFDKKAKEDNTLTDEELDSIAKNKSSEGYDEVLEKIKNTFNSSVNKNRQDREKVSEKTKEDLIELGKNYAKNKNNIADKMSKKGLYFSTINEGLNKQNDVNYVSNVKSAEESRLAALKKLDDEIKTLEKNKNDAINKLDTDSYKKYVNLLGDLTEKRDKERNKIFQYNEDLKAEKLKFDQKRERLIKELEEKDRIARNENAKLIAEQEKINGYTGEKKDNYDKRYDLAFEFYSSLPRDLSIRAIKSNHSLKGYLGNYYDTLLSAMYERGSAKKLMG